MAITTAISLSSGIFATRIDAHPGGTNRSGCHNNSQTGGYHCHRGGSSSSSSNTHPQNSSQAPRSCIHDSARGSTAPGREREFYQTLWIDGNELRSRVNLRSRPGFEHEPDAYGLVGDFVTSTAIYFDRTCTLWVQVYFPGSGYMGWIHGDYVIRYARAGYTPIPDGQGYEAVLPENAWDLQNLDAFEMCGYLAHQVGLIDRGREARVYHVDPDNNPETDDTLLFEIFRFSDDSQIWSETTHFLYDSEINPFDRARQMTRQFENMQCLKRVSDRYGTDEHYSHQYQYLNTEAIVFFRTRDTQPGTMFQLTVTIPEN